MYVEIEVSLAHDVLGKGVGNAFAQRPRWTAGENARQVLMIPAALARSGNEGRGIQNGNGEEGATELFRIEFLEDILNRNRPFILVAVHTARDEKGLPRGLTSRDERREGERLTVGKDVDEKLETLLGARGNGVEVELGDGEFLGRAVHQCRRDGATLGMGPSLETFRMIIPLVYEERSASIRSRSRQASEAAGYPAAEPRVREWAQLGPETVRSPDPLGRRCRSLRG